MLTQSQWFLFSYEFFWNSNIATKRTLSVQQTSINGTVIVVRLILEQQDLFASKSRLTYSNKKWMALATLTKAYKVSLSRLANDGIMNHDAH